MYPILNIVDVNSGFIDGDQLVRYVRIECKSLYSAFKAIARNLVVAR